MTPEWRAEAAELERVAKLYEERFLQNVEWAWTACKAKREVAAAIRAAKER